MGISSIRSNFPSANRCSSTRFSPSKALRPPARVHTATCSGATSESDGQCLRWLSPIIPVLTTQQGIIRARATSIRRRPLFADIEGWQFAPFCSCPSLFRAGHLRRDQQRLAISYATSGFLAFWKDARSHHGARFRGTLSGMTTVLAVVVAAWIARRIGLWMPRPAAVTILAAVSVAGLVGLALAAKRSRKRHDLAKPATSQASDVIILPAHKC